MAVLRAVTEARSDAPEALMISALLSSGTFDPARYRLSEDDLECWEDLWAFCLEHQRSAGRAPGVHLVTSRFPDFTPVRGIDPAWAAANLHTISDGRRLRHRMSKAVAELNDGDVEAAYKALEGLRRTGYTPMEHASVFDSVNYADRLEDTTLPVPWPSLDRATGGIRAGDFWLYAGRPGVGKTYSACRFNQVAAEAGARTLIFSLEMPSRSISKRVMRLLTHGDRALLAKVTSDEERLRKEAAIFMEDKLLPGSIKVTDPSKGRVTPGRVEEAAASGDFDLITVDHVGLMGDGRGGRAVDDWRTLASVSNQLKEIALSHGVPILGCVQVNRKGESSSGQPAGLDTLAGSDALGQDCDVLVSVGAMSHTARRASAEKVREGEPAKWFFRFDVARVAFEEVTFETAQEIASLDIDRYEV